MCIKARGFQGTHIFEMWPKLGVPKFLGFLIKMIAISVGVLV